MENSKLLGILRSLTAAEQNDLLLYLGSGYLAAASRLSQLCGYIIGRMSSGKETTKKSIHSRFFAGKTYDDKKVRYMLTDLTKQVEEYLTQRTFEKDEELKRSLLARSLAAKRAEKAYNAVFAQARERAETCRLKDAEHYYYNYLFEYNHLVYERQPGAKRQSTSNIELVVSNLDKFYIARKLQLCCEIFNSKNVLSSDYNAFLLTEILEQLGNHTYEDTPVIMVYYQILMTLLETDNEQHFEKLTALLKKHESCFSLDELRDMYQHVFNYCIKKINLGNISYQQVLFDTYKITLGNKVLLTEGSLSQWDYKNIVTISLRLKEFRWAKDFINEYRSLLRPPERENAYVYNLAYWHFHSREYSKTLNLLQKVSFTDLYYQLDTRAILLKLYYEQDDTDSLFYHIAAFKTFLQRNKLISDYQRTIYTNLIRYTARLARAGNNTRKLLQLRDEIENKKQVADIQWLKQKVNELCVV